LAGALFQTLLGKFAALSQTLYLDLRDPASKVNGGKGKKKRSGKGKRGRNRRKEENGRG